MKNVGLLSSNLPRVIDRSHLSPIRFEAELEGTKTDHRTDSRNADSGNGDQVTTATAVSHAFPWCVRFSSNIPGFVSVDLIGENNQVILEIFLNQDHKRFAGIIHTIVGILMLICSII